VRKNVDEKDVEKINVEDFVKHYYAYEDVPEPEADAVLVVVFNIPGLASSREYRFPLKRDPDAKSSSVWTSSLGWAADGVSKDGHGIGHVGSIRLEEGDATHITVRLSLSGTDQDLKDVVVGETLLVPWLGHAEKKLPHGGRFEVHFEKRGTENSAITP
jgi:hypothetical protein